MPVIYTLMPLIFLPCFRMPKIVVQRAEEIFPAVREGMNYTNSEKVLVGPHGETYQRCYDANQAMNIKAEDISDAAEEEDPVSITIQEMKAKHESYSNSENVLVGPYGEMYPASHDADQAMNIKAEDISDVAEEEDPLPVTIQEIKAEPESYSNSENVLVGPYGEQAMNVKAEEVSDVAEEEDPLRITFQEIKAEPESNLNELQPVHGEERQYSCNECGDSFSQQFNLRTHQRINSGEWSFCCDVCNKSFNRQGHLKTHRRIHSGERPFSCDVCNKSFNQRSDMKKHRRIHSGERPFCCSLCSKSFSELGDLKTHQRIHSGERPFCCNVCNKSFSCLTNLKTHQHSFLRSRVNDVLTKLHGGLSGGHLGVSKTLNKIWQRCYWLQTGSDAGSVTPV
ncbi:zinc finger and SCAN domain-containing protein 12 [Cryptotermes secundus]|uniref:zinc finger and SCAN domain-containing protein 12 n=1 Tax=Cryptotermes secundus TaxID=105785 RepID=UPI000CD7C0FA|nr:zinc finger and SCAN domain-containing protein 12 [Cryptotermes secundus]